MERPLTSWIRSSLAVGLIAALGCAHAPAPRPIPLTLPEGERLLASLVDQPCSGPFRAHLRLQILAPGQRPAGIDGTLTAALPDTLWLSASIGAFRPLFALLVRADSCQLLFHQQKRYWESAHNDPDWAGMNPAAWAEALSWALCPRALLERFHPDGVPSQSGGLVWLDGSLAGASEKGETSVRVGIGLAPPAWSVREFWVRQDGRMVLTGAFGRPREVAGAELPTSFSLTVPVTQWSLRGELRDLRRLERRRLLPLRFSRPAGWLPVDLNSSTGSTESPWSVQPN